MTKTINQLEKELSSLSLKEREIRDEKSNIKEKMAKEFFKDITISKLEKIWNKGDFSRRAKILEMNPSVEYHIDKLDSYGGLRAGEIEDDILESKFNESEWCNFNELYKDYLKREK